MQDWFFFNSDTRKLREKKDKLYMVAINMETRLIQSVCVTIRSYAVQ